MCKTRSELPTNISTMVQSFLIEGRGGGKKTALPPPQIFSGPRLNFTAIFAVGPEQIAVSSQNKKVEICRKKNNKIGTFFYNWKYSILFFGISILSDKQYRKKAAQYKRRSKELSVQEVLIHFLYSKLLLKMGHDFLDWQYLTWYFDICKAFGDFKDTSFNA